MKHKLFTFALLLLSFVQVAVAQNFDVEGIVIDTENEPVIGASVVIKGTTSGTITDVDGKFALKGVKSSDVLLVSYVGMISQEVKAAKSLSIVMEYDSQKLDEVLVVAFGEQKRSSFTGSAAVVDSKQLESRQVTNAMDALNGQVAGLQMVNTSGAPDSTPSLLIRGISSINSGTSPLIILDGSPYDGGMNNINPADIESMTVLKDAASNALYGARGANGVIMITTKQASRGDAKITLDMKWGANKRGSELYETITDPRMYYETHYKSLYNYYANNGMPLYDAHVQANNTLGANSTAGGLGYLVYTAPNGEYLIGENGKMNPNAVLGNRVYNKGNYYTLLPDNWIDEAYRTSLRQEYNLNINGGNEKSQFYASIGYLNNEGIVKNSSYERYTARLKGSYQAKNWLKVGANANFTRSDSKSVSDSDDSTNLFAMLSTMAPIYPIYIRDANGDIMTDENGRMHDYGNAAVHGVLRPVLANLNPLQTNTLDTSKTNSNMWSINGYADITPFEGLKITFNATMTENESKSTYTVAPFYGYGAMSYPTGYASKYDYRTLSLNVQQLINYTKSFGNHNMTLLAGHEYYRYNYDTLTGSKTGMADYWGNQELAGAVTTISTNSTARFHNTEGYLFRGLYNYNEKYHANISYRRDASSRFHPDNRWGNFYSFGAAWIMTQEKWLENVKWLNMLKVKASFGQQGNDAIGDFRYTDTYSINNMNGDVALSFSSKGNKDITWETNSNFNAGVEFELFKSRISGGIEYFYRKTTDMLLYVSDPMTSGYTGHYENIGDMVNKGVELELRGAPISTKDFTWDLNLNFTLYRNKVAYLSETNKGLVATEYMGSMAYNGAKSGNYFIGEGLPMHTWYLPKYLGVNELGEALYACGSAPDGKTTLWSSADYLLCGDPNPDFYGGFGTSLSYKGLSLSVNFAYSVGGDVFDSGYRSLMSMPSLGITGNAFHKDVLNAWTAENPSNTIPRLQFNDLDTGYSSSRWLTDGSYLALQNVNFSYSLPNKLLKPLQLTGLKLYVSGENLFIWSKRKGMDPRTVSGFNGYISTSNYAPMRTITGGVTVNF